MNNNNIIAVPSLTRNSLRSKKSMNSSAIAVDNSKNSTTSIYTSCDTIKELSILQIMPVRAGRCIVSGEHLTKLLLSQCLG